MSDDLKSCPFCGSDDLGSGGDDKVVGYWCNSCQAAGSNHYGRYEWNSRADRIEELQARVDKLEKDLGCADAYQREWEQHCKTAEARAEELEANINIKADFIDATINQLSASDQHIEELESKLAKAVVLLGQWRLASAGHVSVLSVIDKHDATLAELTWGKTDD